MASDEPMSHALASISTRRDKASNALSSLEAHRNLISACISKWHELERSFGAAEKALQQKFKELADRETEFDAKTQETRAALDEREAVIASREEAALALVKEQKDSALAEILEERKKLEEETLRKNDGAIIMESGSDRKWSLDDIEEKIAEKTDPSIVKDNQLHGTGTGVGTVADDATQKGTLGKGAPESDGVKLASGSDGNAILDDRKNLENKVSEKTVPSRVKDNELHGKGTRLDSVADAATEKGTLGKGAPKVSILKSTPHGKDELLKKKKRKDKQSMNDASVKRPKEASMPNKSDSNDAHSLEEAISQVKQANEVEIVSQMKSFIEKMDGQGLLELLTENTKDISSCGSELQLALQSSTDPCNLVLKAFEGYENVQKAPFSNKTPQACILLLEKLSEIIADPILGATYPVVPADARELAKMVASNLKSKLELSKKDDYTSVQLFLQFLATFGLGTEYNDEYLLEYVVSLSRCCTGPALCRSLGLTEKIPALVEKLIREKKQLEAIAFASSFGLMDKINPGNLLRSYLKDSERAAQSLIEKAWSKASGLNDAHLKQVSALKHAIKTIEEYNLQSFLSPEDVKKRISALEEKKLERKKATSALKQDRKFSRNVQGSNNFNTGIGVDTSSVKSGMNVSAERSKYMPTDFRRSTGFDYVPADFGPSFHPYRPLNQYDYDRRHESDYSFSSLNPVSHVNPYVREVAGQAMYPGISGSNANYLHDNGLPPSNYLPPFYRR